MKTSLLKITTFGFLAATGAAFAHSGATGIVKERMESMEAIGKSMKVLGGMFAGKIDFNAKAVQKAASVISKHGAKISQQYPKGSDHKPTRALPVVWQNKDEFDKIATDLVMAAKALSVKAEGASDIGGVKPELIAVGRNCKACHKKFRAPEK